MSMRSGRGLKAMLAAGVAVLALGAGMEAQARVQAQVVSVAGQDLGSTLTELGRRYGREVIFSADLVRGRRAQAVSGRLTLEQALTTALTGTGLGWRVSGSGAIVIEAAAQADAVATVEDVVVTAQRRAERGQDVPVAVTAIGRDAIEDYRLDTLRDVSRVTPGLLVASFSPSKPVVAIRGATNTFSQIGVEKPIGILVDDVFIPRNAASTFDLYGLESIQVLKGPQGTLFGRNVTGGVIVIDTGRPAFGRDAASVRATAASFDTRELDALADLSLSETAAVRLAAAVRQSDGWGRDRLTGQTLDDRDSRNARGQVRLALSDAVELRLAGDIARDKSGGRTLSSIGAGDDGDRRTAEAGVASLFEREVSGASARLFWTTDAGQLTSVTAYRFSDATDVFSNVAANFRFLTGTQSQALTDDREEVRTLSQEVRFASRDFGPLRFVIGAYHAEEEAERQLRSTALAAITGALVTNQLADQTVDSRTTAVFADGALDLTDTLSLTLGGRYTWDTKEAGLIRTDFRNAANNFALAGLSSDWSEFTPRAVLSWQPNPDLLAYASYARGYTAGGYNTEAATAAALQAPFAPETLDSYELGLKSEWLDRRVRLNLSAFRSEYKDKQELFFNNVTRVLNITNAAEATMQGVDLEARWRANDWLRFGATWGFLETNYENFVIPGGANNTGNRLGSSPRHKASLNADFDVPVGSDRVFGNLLYAFTSNYYTGAARDPGLRVPGYALVNASLGYGFGGDRYELTGFVRNALDEEYILIPSVQVVRGQYLGEPRTWGVSLTARF